MKSVDIYRELTSERPAMFRSDLARSLNDVAIGQSVLGHLDEAQHAAEEVVNLCRELSPGAFKPDFAMSFNNLSSLNNHSNQLGQETVHITAVKRSESKTHNITVP